MEIIKYNLYFHIAQVRFDVEVHPFVASVVRWHDFVDSFGVSAEIDDAEIVIPRFYRETSSWNEISEFADDAQKRRLVGSKLRFVDGRALGFDDEIQVGRDAETEQIARAREEILKVDLPAGERVSRLKRHAFLVDSNRMLSFGDQSFEKTVDRQLDAGDFEIYDILSRFQLSVIIYF